MEKAMFIRVNYIHYAFPPQFVTENSYAKLPKGLSYSHQEGTSNGQYRWTAFGDQAFARGYIRYQGGSYTRPTEMYARFNLVPTHMSRIYNIKGFIEWFGVRG
ncbi:hypothetical protein [Myroides odoratimimus]|uniref:hypothetical protein n=1 Tax=Myroides odoratimimus TaxID=76832 RepID=UPI00046833E6|nr:hypothetical protein [Myroides odoratimimus]